MVRTVRDQIEYETYRKMILAHVGLVGFTLLFAIIFLAVRPRFEAQYTGVLIVLAMFRRPPRNSPGRKREGVAGRRRGGALASGESRVAAVH